MKTNQILSKVLTLVIAGVVLVGLVVWNTERASAIIVIDGKVNFGIVTLLPASQNARLNFVRQPPEGGDIDDPNIRPCRVEVTIFDAAGHAAFGTPDTYELKDPGLFVGRNILPANTDLSDPLQFRTVLRVIGGPGDLCNVISTMEVFNRETRGTLFMVNRQIPLDIGDLNRIPLDVGDR